MPEQKPIVYGPMEQPDVEVLVDGEWHPGEVRMVKWPNGVEIHEVQWRPPGSNSRRIDDFTADRVRADTVDRSRGRG